MQQNELKRSYSREHVPIKTERWKELCALAAVEQDSERLLELVQEICKLLDEIEEAEKTRSSSPRTIH